MVEVHSVAYNSDNRSNCNHSRHERRLPILSCPAPATRFRRNPLDSRPHGQRMGVLPQARLISKAAVVISRALSAPASCLIPAPPEQNICGEGASFRRRFLLEIPDRIFCLVNALHHFRFSKSGVRSVIRMDSAFLQVDKSLGKFLDSLRKLTEALGVPASFFGVSVIRCPVGQYPGRCSPACPGAAYKRIRTGARKAVEHGVIRRTDGALEISAPWPSLRCWDQLPRRLDEIFRRHGSGDDRCKELFIAYAALRRRTGQRLRRQPQTYASSSHQGMS